MNEPISVYLCGPMAANTPAQANGWRQNAIDLLTPHGFTVISPLRGTESITKNHYRRGEKLGTDMESRGNADPSNKASIMKSVTIRDRFDVRKAGLVLANFTHIGVALHGECGGSLVQIPSVGSDFEMAWAYAQETPIVMVAPPGNYYREHPFAIEAASAVFDTLTPACEWIVTNFGIYVAPSPPSPVRSQPLPYYHPSAATGPSFGTVVRATLKGLAEREQ